MRAFIEILLAVFALEACVFLCVCFSARLPRKIKSVDCIIIPGARVCPDRTPSHALEFRLNKALEAYRRGIAPIIIVCGGQGADEPLAESECMRDYLTGAGVPAMSVLQDARSVNTIENLKNAKALMDRRHLSTAAIVTSDYHLSRTLFIAERLGISACGIPAPSVSRFPKWLEGRLRETVSWQLCAVKAFLGRVK